MPGTAMTNARMGHDFPRAGIGDKLRRRDEKRMQDMLLHWSPRSPFVRKVMIAAHELGVTPRLRTVRTLVASATPNLELMRRNPQSRLPTLELGDGTVLYDSRVICEYFDSLHDGAALFPKTPRERWIALRRQALGDGMLDTLLMWRTEQLRPTARRSAEHIDAWRLKTITSVGALDKEADALRRSPFSIGHIALGVALGYIDFRFAELDWRKLYPGVAAWHATFNARPSVAANQPADDS
jgi:glutathione S-transferase